MGRSLGWLLLALPCVASVANAASNLSASLTFESSDAACESPVYLLSGIVDHTTNDALGLDYIGVIWYDAGLDILDNDFLSVASGIKVPFGSIGAYVMTSRFNNRPLKARVYDIASPGILSENSSEGAAFTASGTLIGEFEIDPATDLAACADRNDGRSLRSLGGVNNSPQLFSDGDWHVLPIDGATSSISVVLPEPAMLVAMFSAECTINDANIHSFLDVDLLVDGVAIPPTDGPESFCPPRPSFDQWTTARAVGVAEFPPGGHVVSVRGRLDFFNAGDQWRLDDTSTVVLIPEPSGPWQLLPGLMLLAWLARRRARVAAGLLALIVLAIAPATSRAETSILHASNTTAQQFSDASSHALLLDGVNTTLVVAPTQAVRLVITYSAECTVSASDTFSWLEIDILLDGSEVNLGDDAFCTSHGVAALDEWLTVSRTIQVDIPAGLHVLGVAGILRNFNAGEQWRIDDAILSVLVIELP